MTTAATFTIAALLPMLFGLYYFLVRPWIWNTWQAKRRGYSGWFWFVLSVLVINPILVTVLLSLLPDARRLRLRKRYLEELEEDLADLDEARLSQRDTPIPAQSIGDQPTILPSRSIGDEETRA